MNGRNRQQPNPGYGRRNDYDRGYDQQNYGRHFEGDRVFEGQNRSTASEYPEYMDQHNSYNTPPSSRSSRMQNWSPENGTDYRANEQRLEYRSNERERSPSYSHSSYDSSSYNNEDRGRLNREQRDYGLNRELRDYDYDQYSRSSASSYGRFGSDSERQPRYDQQHRSYDNSSNRGYNQGFGQSHQSPSRSDYGVRDWESGSSQSRQSQYGQGQYGLGQYAQGQYGQSQYGQNQYGQGQYGQSQYGQGQSQGRYSGVAPKGYKRSDERIKEELNDALTHDPHIDASEIDVTVESGVITLKGTVSERAMKRMAEDTAERIRGVSDVKNELRVQAESSTSNKRTWSDSMTSMDGKSSDKNDTDTTSTRGGKTGSRTTSTDSKTFQS